jgi:cytochrome c-type biogenesis protein CcmF
MVVAHLGIGVFIVGVTMVRGYETERDVRLNFGDHVDLAGWRFTFQGVQETRGPNYSAVRGSIEVRSVDDPAAAPFILSPEKRVYRVQQMPMTEAAIHSRLTGDLYVALGEPLGERSWTLRVHHKPFVAWIWGGAVFMALGGLLAVCDRRYRVAVKRDDALPAGAWPQPTA